MVNVATPVLEDLARDTGKAAISRAHGMP